MELEEKNIEFPDAVFYWTNKKMHRLWKLRGARYQLVKIKRNGRYLWVNKKRPAFKRALKKEETRRKREYRAAVKARAKAERAFFAEKNRPRTQRAKDAAIARHRAAAQARGERTKRDLAEVIAGLSKEEQAVLAGSEHAVSAVEKILEAMLFRFS